MSPPLLDVSGLAFVRSGMRILDDITFSLSAGSTMAIIGRSGAGKTLLLRLLAGLEQPTSGRMRLGEVALERLPEEDWRSLRQGIGLVTEEGSLLHDLTVAENLALPLITRQLPAEEVEARLDHSLISFGLDAWRDARADELSGILSKRVQLARAVIGGPNLLLCDAPFDGLDTEAREELADDLSQMVSHRGTALLITARDRAYGTRLGATMMQLERGRLTPLP